MPTHMGSANCKSKKNYSCINALKASISSSGSRMFGTAMTVEIDFSQPIDGAYRRLIDICKLAFRNLRNRILGRLMNEIVPQQDFDIASYKKHRRRLGRRCN